MTQTHTHTHTHTHTPTHTLQYLSWHKVISNENEFSFSSLVFKIGLGTGPPLSNLLLCQCVVVHTVRVYWIKTHTVQSVLLKTVLISRPLECKNKCSKLFVTKFLHTTLTPNLPYNIVVRSKINKVKTATVTIIRLIITVYKGNHLNEVIFKNMKRIIKNVV